MKSKTIKRALSFIITCIMMLGVFTLNTTASAADTSSPDSENGLFEAGKYLYMGTYENVYYEKPILWRVMSVDEVTNTAVLMSEYVLDAMTFGTTDGSWSGTWSSSSACGFLNGTFYNSSFTADEKNAILPYSNNPDESQYVLLPSKNEIETWFVNSSNRIASYFTGTERAYWLRSMTSPTLADVVDRQGNIISILNNNGWGQNLPNTPELRPVIKVDLTAAMFNDKFPVSVTVVNNSVPVPNVSVQITGPLPSGPVRSLPVNPHGIANFGLPAGDYTVTVRGMDAADLFNGSITVSSEGVTGNYIELAHGGMSKLAAPTGLSFSTSGTASWDSVDNAVGYTIQLYRGAIVLGASINTSGTTYDFASVAKANGPGVYTFAVKALGDNTGFVSSDFSARSESYTLAGFTVNTDVNELKLGVSKDNTATVTATLIPLVSGVAYEWSILSGGEFITLEGSGLTADITAKAAGTAQIQIKASTDYHVSTKTVTVIVTKPELSVDGITVSPESASVERGGTQQFTADVSVPELDSIPLKMWGSPITGDLMYNWTSCIDIPVNGMWGNRDADFGKFIPGRVLKVTFDSPYSVEHTRDCVKVMVNHLGWGNHCKISYWDPDNKYFYITYDDFAEFYTNDSFKSEGFRLGLIVASPNLSSQDPVGPTPIKITGLSFELDPNSGELYTWGSPITGNLLNYWQSNLDIPCNGMWGNMDANFGELIPGRVLKVLYDSPYSLEHTSDCVKIIVNHLGWAHYCNISYWDPDNKYFYVTYDDFAEFYTNDSFKSDGFRLGIIVAKDGMSGPIGNLGPINIKGLYFVPDPAIYDVTWSVNSVKSTIDADGLLTVGADETAETLTVTATSVFDDTVFATADITTTVKVGDVELGFDVVEDVVTLKPSVEDMTAILETSGPEIVIDLRGFASVELTVDAALFKDSDKLITIVTENGSYSVKTKSLFNDSGKPRIITVSGDKLEFKNGE